MCISDSQYTREDLLGKIAQEFLDAADDLPDTQSQVGRITKNIAYAYVAKAILYQACLLYTSQLYIPLGISHPVAGAVSSLYLYIPLYNVRGRNVHTKARCKQKEHSLQVATKGRLPEH